MARRPPRSTEVLNVRARLVLPLLAALLMLATPARAAVPHVVKPGETLWTIASANNLTTRTVAAFNGLSENSPVILGSTLMVPTSAEGYAALQRAGIVPAPAPAPASAAGASTAAAAADASPGAPAPQGAYTVRWGDTLSSLAAQAGVSAAAMATMNGLSLSAPLLAGTVIKLPAGAPTPARASEPAPPAVVPAASPSPTPARLTASDIQQVAAANGVSPSLAAAVAWQESGFNNAMVSGANARGVMQVMPGTWQYVEQNLAGRPLDAASAHDNATAGVLYLKSLLAQSGGDESTAIAGYYQGLGSVRSRGLFDDTRRYVANVQALRGRFGG
jgi:soluble lytic murein transglycosylase-like protein